MPLDGLRTQLWSSVFFKEGITRLRDITQATGKLTSAAPVFSEQQGDDIAKIIAKFLNLDVHTALHRAADQPFRLNLMEALATKIIDVDQGLPQMLAAGIKCGIGEPIPNSAAFYKKEAAEDWKFTTRTGRALRTIQLPHLP